MKKLIALLLVVAMVLSLAACGGEKNNTADFKAGFIFLHDENSTYDLNFMNAAKEACEALGVEYIIKVNIPESEACYDAAAELVDMGCTYIFADSFGHEPYMIQAAKEFTDVQFCHATGTQAHTADVPNYHNAFASIYEGRFLAGIAAGLKLVEMDAAGELEAENYADTAQTTIKMGYVGAFPYAEVKSGYTSYFLGARLAVNAFGDKDVSMDVTFTNSWYDPTAEANGAELLINRGAALISQHADSMGAPSTCEAAGVPNVSYNGSTETACPNTFIVSSYIDWTPYFEYMINCTIEGIRIATDWTGTMETGSVKLTEFGAKATAQGTADLVAQAAEALKAGELHVFDSRLYTVGGVHPTSYLADVHNRNFAHDVEAMVAYSVPTGAVGVYETIHVFAESSLRSAPYFDMDIDGINLLTAA